MYYTYVCISNIGDFSVNEDYDTAAKQGTNKTGVLTVIPVVVTARYHHHHHHRESI